jgi:hypothetical protein
MWKIKAMAGQAAYKIMKDPETENSTSIDFLNALMRRHQVLENQPCTIDREDQ